MISFSDMDFALFGNLCVVADVFDVHGITSLHVLIIEWMVSLFGAFMGQGCVFILAHPLHSERSHTKFILYGSLSSKSCSHLYPKKDVVFQLLAEQLCLLKMIQDTHDCSVTATQNSFLCEPHGYGLDCRLLNQGNKSLQCPFCNCIVCCAFPC